MSHKWLRHERGRDKWEPEVTFANPVSDTVQRDFLSRVERDQIREAALSYGSIPNYNAVTPEERRRYKRYLARRFGKSMDDVGLDDWERANSYKYPSLVYVSLDCGLRPIEVERASVDWVDCSRNRLWIPKDGSRKDEDPWTCSLTEKTTEMCRRWLQQREAIPLYDDTDALWLTDKGNRYTSQSLSYVCKRLFEEAGIETKGRQTSWYTIRRNCATHLIDETDISTAKAQMRHKNVETTIRYDMAPEGRVRDALDRF